MPADTAAKRYSALNIACPWRGLNVVPNVAIPQGERQAVMFMYSGILAGPLSVTAASDGKQFLGEIQQLGIGAILDANIGVM